MSTPELSVVLPVYNEEENIPLVHQEVKAALEKLGRSYEILYVDDGSKDASFERLSEIATDDPAVSVIRFRRNFGQTAALSAGIERSRGDIIILMDADLQNDPNDFGKILAKIDEGNDVVSGWRKDRQDATIKRKIPSKIANALISQVTGVKLHDYGCTLKAYRREVLDPVRLYGEMHRFIPVYASWNGARITEIAVNHRARRFGQSKYGLSRTIRVLMDLLTVKFLGGYSTKPLYAFGTVGLVMGGASILSLAYAILDSVANHTRVHNQPFALLSAILFGLAVQTILLGLLAELLSRTYYESQGKSTYVIRSVIIGTQKTAPQFARTRARLQSRGDPTLPDIAGGANSIANHKIQDQEMMEFSD
ncbi:MAG TPA: glycosyltransferase family 2 protein [Ktedonobacterales bacterium]|nr:glycosyltransferase family 2 protein [Ktedonobacterales bacterium]